MLSKILNFMKRWGFPAAVCIAIAVAFFTRGQWWEPLQNRVAVTIQSQRPEIEEDEETQPATSTDSLKLSAQARRNIGLTPAFLKPLELQTYQKTISIPAVIVERPGRTRIEVSTPLTGIITHVHSVTGESVTPGTLLFEIRLTHEDLVKTQTEFVQSLGELEVEKRELKRLEGIASSGAVAGKLVLERQYAIDKLTVFLNAQRESLRLHGLNDKQIGQLEESRSLLKSLQIFAPSVDSHAEDEFKFTRTDVQQVSVKEEQPAPLAIHQLHVKKGQSVTAGETLCELVDYSQLFIEGRAFERDSTAVTEAVQRNWRVTAMFESSLGYEEVPDLNFAFLANSVDQNSRTLSVYVDLPNKIIRDEQNSQGQRFLTWNYRLGQRLQLRIPVEQWKNEFVLPTEAVVNDGVENFVFQENGDHFDRIPVHVKYKDQTSVVIANDGAMFPGDVIARRGAHRMQMTLKNQSGGVDPHAGHTH